MLIWGRGGGDKSVGEVGGHERMSKKEGGCEVYVSTYEFPKTEICPRLLCFITYSSV